MSTWWIEKGSLLGSGNPTETQLNDLSRQGFKVIISLLDEDEQAPNYDINSENLLEYTRYCIPIKDYNAPSLEQVYNFLERMEFVTADSKVLLHCEGGSGRTGTMGAAYWIAKGMSAKDAIRKVRQANSGAVETESQELVLYMLEKDVKRTLVEACDLFRKLVALLYREIGVLDPRNHRELAGKRRLDSDFFPRARKIISHEIYCKSKELMGTEDILRLFEAKTGLSLQDIERAFREGEWRNSVGCYSFGGPKWAKIAKATISMQEAIIVHDISGVKRLQKEISQLKHNNGLIAEKFSQLTC